MKKSFLFLIQTLMNFHLYAGDLGNIGGAMDGGIWNFY